MSLGTARPPSAQDLVTARRNRQKQDAIKATIRQVQRSSDSPYVQTLFSRVVERSFELTAQRPASRLNLLPIDESVDAANTEDAAADDLPPRPPPPASRLSTPTAAVARVDSSQRPSGSLVPVGALLFAPAPALRKGVSSLTQTTQFTPAFATGSFRGGATTTAADDANAAAADLPAAGVDSRRRPPSAVSLYRDKLISMSQVKHPLLAERVSTAVLLPAQATLTRVTSPRLTRVGSAASMIRPTSPQRDSTRDRMMPPRCSSAPPTQVLNQDAAQRESPLSPIARRSLATLQGAVTLHQRPASAMTVYAGDGTATEVLQDDSARERTAEELASGPLKREALRDALRDVVSTQQRGVSYFMTIARNGNVPSAAGAPSTSSNNAAFAAVVKPALVTPAMHHITQPAAMKAPRPQAADRPPTATTERARERTSVLRVRLFRRATAQEDKKSSMTPTALRASSEIAVSQASQQQQQQQQQQQVRVAGNTTDSSVVVCGDVAFARRGVVRARYNQIA